jgi:transposase-like protein
VAKRTDDRTWTPAETRAWVERHGGNISRLARRLRVPRTQLQAWLADPAETSRARPLPPYIQAFMETLDTLTHGAE